MKRVLLVLGLGVCLVAFVAWLGFRGARPARLPESLHADRETAARAGAFELGWLPAFVPAGARELREVHDPTTTRTWGRFVLAAPGWFPEIKKGALLPGETGLRGPPLKLEWWPADAAGKVSSLVLEQRGWRVTLVDEARGPIFVAVRGTEVVFWRLARSDI